MQNEPMPSTTPQSDPTATPPPQGKSPKALYAVIGIAALIIALLLSAVAYLLMQDDTDDKTAESSTNQTEKKTTATIDKQEVIATVDTSKSGIQFELFTPQRSGNSLVINYRLKNTSDKQSYLDNKVGVYTQETGTSINDTVPEPYVLADDGQKYGLVRDDQGKPLATNSIRRWIDPGETASGYFTLSLPPSGGTLSLSAGSMPTISGIQLNY